MTAPHAFFSKMLAERAASRNVLVLFILFYFRWRLSHCFPQLMHSRRHAPVVPTTHVHKICGLHADVRAVVTTSRPPLFIRRGLGRG